MQGFELPVGDPPDWNEFYLARGADEVVEHRPIMTGDVFTDVELFGADGRLVSEHKSVIILQHPCAIRSDGVQLAERILVAEVRPHRELTPEEWQRFFKFMPLPRLFPQAKSETRDHSAFFKEIYLARREALITREACLSLFGINVLLQRWINHNSRVKVPTHELNKVVIAPYEEVDLVEDWCTSAVAAGTAIEDALRDVDEWLSEQINDAPRRTLLERDQRRPEIRREARLNAASRYR